MEDENKSTEGVAQENNGSTGEENKGTGSEGQETGAKESQNDASATEGESKGGEGDKKPEQENSAPEEPKEPGVRKTKLEYIQERKNRQAAKRQEQQKSSESMEKKDDEGSDGFTPEEEKKFDLYMQKKYGDKLATVDAVVESNVENEIKADVNEFLSTKEGKYFEKHRDKIITWAKHPSRANIPISTIAMEAVGPQGMLAIGAAMERGAAEEARKSQAGGSSTRGGGAGGEKKVSEMSDAEFLAQKSNVLQKQV